MRQDRATRFSSWPPCVLEGYERSLAIGKRAKAICEKLGLPYVFKASSTRPTALPWNPSGDRVWKKG